MQQPCGARANSLRRVESRLARDCVGAAGVDDDRFHSTAAFLQRGLRENDRRGLKSILRKDSGGICPLLREDEAEVGTFFADAGADA